MLLSLPRLSGELEIGFDWLCFLEPEHGTYFDKYPVVKMLHLYGTVRIGFVLRNWQYYPVQ